MTREASIGTGKRWGNFRINSGQVACSRNDLLEIGKSHLAFVAVFVSHADSQDRRRALIDGAVDYRLRIIQEIVLALKFIV